MGVGDRDGVGVGISGVECGVSVCEPMAAVFSASMWMCGWVDGSVVDGGWDGSSRPVCHP
jgi:hypothetical protein